MDSSTVKHESPAKTRKKLTTTDIHARKHGEKITDENPAHITEQ